MLVMVYADGSYCNNTNVGGFGVVIDSPHGKHEQGGSYREPCRSSMYAEMYSCINGLVIGIKRGLVRRGYSVVIVNDSREAMKHLEGSNAETCKLFRSIVKRYRFKVTFRHVKAHTERKGASHIANDRCDHLANQAMRKRRKRVRDAESAEQRKIENDFASGLGQVKSKGKK